MKKNQKLENKFFGPFQVFYVGEKQAYKLELHIRWRIDIVFHMSLLEQDTTRKDQVNNALLEPEKEFKVKDDKEYEVEAIINSVVYGKMINN